MDVKTAFLNGHLEPTENVYMNPPKEIDMGIKKGKVLKLLKAIYGLKKSPKIWNKKWDFEVKRIGFRQLRPDNCVCQEGF